MWHREWLWLDERTAVEAAVDRDRAYRLAMWRDGERVLEFRFERGRHLKCSHARTSSYDFRSIEQLRYDFEREIEDSLAQR